jgi:hypothetical protein
MQFFATHSRPWIDFGFQITECSMSDSNLLATTALDCLYQCNRYSVGTIPDIVDQLYERTVRNPEPCVHPFLPVYRLLFSGIDQGRSFECTEHAIAHFPAVVLASELPFTNFLLSEFSDSMVGHPDFFNQSLFEFLIGIVRDFSRPKGTQEICLETVVPLFEVIPDKDGLLPFCGILFDVLIRLV